MKILKKLVMKILKKLFLKTQQQGEPINLDINFKPGFKKIGVDTKLSFNEWGQKLDPNIIYPEQQVLLKKSIE